MYYINYFYEENVVQKFLYIEQKIYKKNIDCFKILISQENMYIYICKIKIDCIIVCIIVWYMLNMLFVKSK